MVETPILSTGYQSVEELRAINRNLVIQCAERNREFERKLEKSFEENNKLHDKINHLNATIQILEAEIESLKNVRTSSIRTIRPTIPREPIFSTVHFGENALRFGDCETLGNYLELTNDSNRIVQLGDFKIQRIVGDSTIEVSLPDRAKITPEGSLRLYGKKSMRNSTNFMRNIVINQIDTWPTGKIMQTFLLNDRNEEIASVVQTLDE